MQIVRVNEGGTGYYSCTLQKVSTSSLPTVTWEAITLAEISALTITLYKRGVSSDTIINSRDGQSILNVNGGSVHATTGAFTMTFAGVDTAISEDSLAYEEHIAVFTITTTSSVVGYWEAKVRVKNLRQVP